MKKVKIGLIFGGKSAEHAVALNSAAAIYQHLDKEKYDPFLIYINRAGEWSLTGNTGFREDELTKDARFQKIFAS